ncbi:hypothetical protein Cenrod_2231 [Candidatus Symbiobacter mobilis CR]|uniref:Uncharacterized protein n=1 Tax=Candidatus Symbiobacter mobilis CR TaxID=946483 RepID=U5NDI1_9BURK|nr:hypothetical protein Cenrod_2231 [Candidatus Symbiobacter mobilis CR]
MFDSTHTPNTPGHQAPGNHNTHQVASNPHQVAPNTHQLPANSHQVTPNSHQSPANSHQVVPNGHQSRRYQRDTLVVKE